MSPDELLWQAPQLGGLVAKQWVIVVDHLLEQRATFLRIDLEREREQAGGRFKVPDSVVF